MTSSLHDRPSDSAYPTCVKRQRDNRTLSQIERIMDKRNEVTNKLSMISELMKENPSLNHILS